MQQKFFSDLGVVKRQKPQPVPAPNRPRPDRRATGNGKTVTPGRTGRRAFRANGVPVFVRRCKRRPRVFSMARITRQFKHATSWKHAPRNWGWTDYAYSDNPAIFWDRLGKRATPSPPRLVKWRPLLCSRALNGLNETQEGVLNNSLRFARIEEGLTAAELDDMQSNARL